MYLFEASIYIYKNIFSSSTHFCDAFQHQFIFNDNGIYPLVAHMMTKLVVVLTWVADLVASHAVTVIVSFAITMWLAEYCAVNTEPVLVTRRRHSE